MPSEVWRVVLAAVVGAHGIGHVLFLVPCLGIADWGQSTRSWLLARLAGEVGVRAVGSLLWAATTVAFVAVGIGIWAQADWWRAIAGVSAAVSLAGIALFMERRPTQPALNAAFFDAAVLVALLLVRWPPASLVGS